MEFDTTAAPSAQGRALLYSSVVQCAAIAAVLLAQAYFLFPAEAATSPAGFYLMANILTVSCLCLAAAASPRSAQEARLPLLAAGIVFALLFAHELRWNGDSWLEDGSAMALWAFAALSVAFIVRLPSLPALVRISLMVAVALQGLAVASDLIEDGALGVTPNQAAALDWIYLAGNLASMAAYQVALLHIVSEGSLFGAILRSLGIAPDRGLDAASDPRFAKWKLANPDGDYGAFYAHRVSRKLDRGLSHKTLGGRIHLSEGVVTKAKAYDNAGFRERGAMYFDWFAARALRRDMTCVDFGCGSLRVGQHFMRFLDPDRYIGLDVVDRFWREGLKLIERETIERQRPTLGTICPEQLARAAARRPDLVYSTAVLQHVPPEEIDAYLSKLVGLISENGVVVTNFKAAYALTRTGASNWIHEPARLIEAVYRVDPCAHAAVVDGWRFAKSGFEQATLVIARDPALIADWARRPARAA